MINKRTYLKINKFLFIVLYQSVCCTLGNFNPAKLKLVAKIVIYEIKLVSFKFLVLQFCDTLCAGLKSLQIK